MTTPKANRGKGAPGPTGPASVDEFLRKLSHPRKPELEAVRKIVLGTHPEIREGIKWNAPSFHFKEYFATLNVRSDVVHLLFHRGAKARDGSTGDATIDDPEDLLIWHAADRCSVKFQDMKEVKSGASALRRIVAQWIEGM